MRNFRYNSIVAVAFTYIFSNWGSRKQWINRFKGVATKYLDNYLAWLLFVDSRCNESTKQHIKEFLLTSFVFEMTETYDSLRLSKFNVSSIQLMELVCSRRKRDNFVKNSALYFINSNNLIGYLWANHEKF